MIGLTVTDPQLAAKLAAAKSPTFLRGEDGSVLGYFDPRQRPAPEKLEPPIDYEEVIRQANDPNMVWVPASEVEAMIKEML